MDDMKLMTLCHKLYVWNSHIVEIGPHQYWRCGWNLKLVKTNDSYQILENEIDGMDE